MILPVYVYGAPVLRKVAENINSNQNGLSELIDNMFETMYNADGVGLAAPQVGELIRLFIVDAAPLVEDEPSLKGFKKVFINPQITERIGDKWEYTEGCLSIPNIREDVERPDVIKIEYLDENFKHYSETFEGVKARIIQHEYDHLDGVLFVDKLSPIRKKLLKPKLQSISKGKFEANYKVKPHK